MKKIGSNRQDLIKEAPSNNTLLPVKVASKLFFGINGKMFYNSRLTLACISVVTSLTIVGTHGEAFALRRGDNNSDVRNVQSCLKRLGYFNGPVNGNFGPMTESAVTRFQQDRGINAIGVVGPRTQRALQSRCGRGGSSVSASDCQRGLRNGCNGSEVRRLQRNLTALGVYNGPVTGRFRELTRNAVIRFQQQKGINPIGVVGPRTREAIRVALNRQQQPVNRPTNPIGQPCDYRTEVIRIGCRSEWITRMQQRLKDLGYFLGNPTGYFGPITRDAVVRFQQDNRLPVTGNVDSRTWGAMNRMAIQTPQPSGFLRMGSQGSQVRTLQQNLKQLNYFYGNPTGFIDSSTQDAVIRFQQDYRLPVTGTVDRGTFEAISLALRSRGGRRDFQALQFGDSNQRVEKLQNRLLELGLLKTNPTGYFGPFTQEAVVAFQRSRGLTDTGFVDRQTWERLGFRVSGEKRYVVVIPLRNQDIFNQVLQYIPSATVGKSSRGDFVNAGEYNKRFEAQKQSQMLREFGFDARVEFL